MAMVDGVKIKMGGQEYEIPPLSFKQLRSLEPKFVVIASMKGQPTGEQVDAVIDVVHAAISRNYPAMQREEVEGLIDLGNMKDVMNAIMGVSGLVGEPKVGEPKAGES